MADKAKQLEWSDRAAQWLIDLETMDPPDYDLDILVPILSEEAQIAAVTMGLSALHVSTCLAPCCRLLNVIPGSYSEWRPSETGGGPLPNGHGCKPITRLRDKNTVKYNRVSPTSPTAVLLRFTSEAAFSMADLV